MRNDLNIFFLIAFLSLTLLGFTACTSSEAVEDLTAKEAVPASELIVQADNAYKLREDLGKLRETVGLLRRARNAEPNNFEAAWKLAQANYFLGDKSADAKESERAFKEGVTAARNTVNLSKEKPEGYFWLGANLGGQSKKDLLSGAANLTEIKRSMEKVIELQPNFQGAAAYDALAQVELNTRLTGGSTEKAIEFAEKGVALDKDNSLLRVTLAECYLAANKKDEAKKQIDFVQKMKPNPDFLPEFKDSLEKAKKLEGKL